MHRYSVWGGAAVVALAMTEACSSSDAASSDGASDASVDRSIPEAGILDASRSPIESGPNAPGDVLPTCVASTGESSVPTSVGGSRLHPIHWASPDGLDVAAGTRDMLAGLDCFEAIGDASARCRPASTPYATIVWTEPTCTPPSLLGASGLAHQVVVVGDTIAWTGDEVLPRPPLFTLNEAGACALAPEPNEEFTIATHLYAIVKASETLVQTGPIRHCVDPLLDATFVHGSDGSQVFTGFLFDHARDLNSKLSRPLASFDDGAGVERWLPADIQPEYCGTGGIPFFFFSQDPPVLGMTAFWKGAVYELVPRTLTANSTDECKAVAPRNGALAGYLLGTRYPVTAFEPAARLDIGGTRRRATPRTAGGGPIVPSVAPYFSVEERPPVRDLELGGMACRPEMAADGVVRCLPPDSDLLLWDSSFAGAFLAYSDSACTAPIAIGPVAGPDPTLVREIRSRFGSCSARVFSVGAAVAPAERVYGRFTDRASLSSSKAQECGECYDITRQLRMYPRATFAVTGELAPSTLAPMTVEVR